jgi:hypothetical protein
MMCTRNVAGNLGGLTGLRASWQRRVFAGLGLLVLAGSLSWPSVGWAQEADKAKREREALRRAQQALMSAQAENASLTSEKLKLSADKAALDKEKTELSEQVKQSSAAAVQGRSRLKAAEARLASQDEELSRLKAELATTQQQNEALTQNLEKITIDARQLVAALRQRLQLATKAQAELQVRNLRLFDLASGLVKVYRGGSSPKVLTDQMGLLGFGKVATENAADAWLDQLEQARWDTVALPPEPLLISESVCHLVRADQPNQPKGQITSEGGMLKSPGQTNTEEPAGLVRSEKTP